MKVVIDIDKELYKKIKKNGYIYREEAESVAFSIIGGIPLPKGHGRLIDADRLREEMEKDVRRAMSFVDLIDFVWLAPTIIKADRSEEG